MIYGIGANAYFDKKEHDSIWLTIVQPNAYHPHGNIRSIEYEPANLFSFHNKVLAAAERTKTEPTTYVPGPHCRWCNGSAICPERHKETQALAKKDFEVVPEQMSTDQIVQVLNQADRVQAFIKSVRSYAYQLINSGTPLNGHKLVQRRSNRQWVDEADMIKKLRDKRVKRADMFDEKLKSPAQIEKVDGISKKFVNKYTTRPDSGLVLVPESDNREAVNTITSAKEDFDDEAW
jgi:hypothetical protein